MYIYLYTSINVSDFADYSTISVETVEVRGRSLNVSLSVVLLSYFNTVEAISIQSAYME